MIPERNKPRPVLHCSRCGFRGFEVHGPVVGGTTVHCSSCGAKAGDLDDLMAIVEERIGRREEKRPARVCH
jgi:ribosomal protein L37E